MADFTWSWQGTTPTEIEATDKIQYAGAGFGDAIQVNEYNDSTHIETSGGSDKSDGNSPRNNKFISQTGGTAGKSEVSIDGAAAIDLDAATNANAGLRINFSDSANVEIYDAVIYAYNGSNTATPPVDVDVRLAEVGDENWTEAEGSGSALALADKTTPATSHDYYILNSIGPTARGEKTGSIRIELTYQ